MRPRNKPLLADGAEYIQQPTAALSKIGSKTKRAGLNNKKKPTDLGRMAHDATTAALAYATGNDKSFLALPT